MLFISILLVQNIFIKKLKHLLIVLCPLLYKIKTLKQIFRVQAYDSIMCRYFCIGFTDLKLAGKTLTEYANLFSPNNFKKNDDIILNYFMNNI